MRAKAFLKLADCHVSSSPNVKSNIFIWDKKKTERDDGFFLGAGGFIGWQNVLFIATDNNSFLLLDFFFFPQVCWSLCRSSRLGSAALDKAWVETHIPNVMSVQNPGEEPFQAQTVTTMRTRAKFALWSQGETSSPNYSRGRKKPPAESNRTHWPHPRSAFILLLNGQQRKNTPHPFCINGDDLEVLL